MRNFRTNTNGIAYLFGMLLIGIFLMAVIYFPLSFVWDHLYAYIVGTYTFTGDSASALTAIQLIISYMLALGIIFFLNYMIVNAKAEGYGMQ